MPNSRWWISFGAVFFLVLLLFTSISSVQGASQPPGVSIISSDLVGSGPFSMLIIVVNTSLAGSITCDKDLTIASPSPPVLFQGQQITPALIEIPPGFPQGTTTVLCQVPISTGVSLPWPLTITFCGGSDQQPCPFLLTVNMTSVTCEAPGKEVNLQITVANGPVPTLVSSITGGNPWLMLAEVSPSPPLLLAPGEEKQFSLRFACKSAGIFSVPFVRLQSEPKGFPPPPTIEQALDTNDNDRIDDAEIIAAVKYWVNDQPVPNTGGQMINDREIIKLAALWVMGTPISSIWR